MIIYLACPYSHPDKAVRQTRYVQANRAAGKLMEAGYVVFSPLSHSHPIDELFDGPKDWAFWKKQDFPFLERCDRLVVLCLDGWRKSVGVTEEIELAESLGIPIEYKMETDF